jgi:cell division protein FtsB
MTKKRLTRFLALLIGFCLIISLSRNIWRLLKASDQIRRAKEELQALQGENQALLEKKDYYQSEEFIEEEARNKLNMAWPEEIVVILPPNVQEIVGRTEGVKSQVVPNWQKWWELFF